jgi:hypothetical protein
VNPWLWLLWALAVLVLVFIASAAIAAIVGGMRKQSLAAVWDEGRSARPGEPNPYRKG